MFRGLKLSTKLLALTIGIILTFAALLLWICPIAKQGITNSKYIKSKQIVETAAGVVENYIQQANDKLITVTEAKKKAADAVARLRYGNEDYFWINDLEPRMIMHPKKPKLNGEALTAVKDPNGKALFMEMVRVCRSTGEGFVEYSWPKPGATKPEPKISYVKLLPEWGWIKR